MEALDDIDELQPTSCCAVQEQVIRSGDSNGVLSGMPASVQYLLVEVERIQLHSIPKASRTGRTVLNAILGAGKGASDLLGFER